MKTKIAFAVLSVLLAVSVGLNVVLYRSAVAYYRDGQEVRLDPTGERHFGPANERLTAPKADEVRVVFVGDSRIEQWEPPPAPDGCQVVNRGAGGETTTQVLLRLERDVVRLDPAVVVVQAGINDLKGIGVLPERAEEIITTCTQNLRTIVARLRERGVRVVVLTVLPVGPIDLARRPLWSDATLAGVSRVNDAIRGMKAPGITVVDCDPLMAVDGRMNPAYARDAFHLTRDGYQALNGTVTPVLETLLRELRHAETGFALGRRPGTSVALCSRPEGDGSGPRRRDRANNRTLSA